MRALRRQGFTGRAFLLGALVCAATTACADFLGALGAYREGRLEEARSQFLDLAALGDGASQYNLGVMALNGEGRPRDRGEAVGWMLAARQNNYQAVPALDKIGAALTTEERAIADGILARYGRQHLLDTVLPADVPCPGWENPSSDRLVVPEYPGGARQRGADGIVVVEVTIGTDGLAREPEIVASEPGDVFDAASIDAMLSSRFHPARYQGEPRERRGLFKYNFKLTPDAGELWNLKAFSRVQAAADTGHPAAQYVIGIVSYLDPSLGIAQPEAFEMILSSAQGGEPRAQYFIADYLGGGACVQENKVMTWLRQAARAGEPAAQWMLAEWLVRRNGPAAADEVRGLLEGVANTESAYALTHAIAFAAAGAPAEVRDETLAAKLAGQLTKTVRTKDPHREEVLAASAAASGRFDKAVSLQTLAIKKARRLHWNTSLMEQRLVTYRAKQAWQGNLFEVPPATSIPPPRGKVLSTSPGR